MAVGSTINFSIPVVGTTVSAFTRVAGNIFTAAMTLTSSWTASLVIRAAGVQTTNARFGLVMRIKPSDNDDPGTLTKGNVTVSINIDAQKGTEITSANLAKAVRYALSTALHSNLIEDLSNGQSL